MTQKEGGRKGLRGVEVGAWMKLSLRFVRLLAVRDERMISHAGSRNAYTNTFPPPGLYKERGGGVQTCHRDWNRSMSTNTFSKR